MPDLKSSAAQSHPGRVHELNSAMLHVKQPVRILLQQRQSPLMTAFTDCASQLQLEGPHWKGRLRRSACLFISTRTSIDDKEIQRTVSHSNIAAATAIILHDERDLATLLHQQVATLKEELDRACKVRHMSSKAGLCPAMFQVSSTFMMFVWELVTYIKAGYISCSCDPHAERL